MEQTRVALVDGRRVAYVEHGDPAGRAVFFLHGTPDSRVGKEYLGPPAAARGLRVICADRPGIGGSDPLPARTIPGSAAELTALADALDVGRFAVVGYSGGGPYAIAAAAGCGDRITTAVLAAGAGPLDRPGAREGMSPSDRQLVDLARHRPRQGAALLRFERLATRLRPGLAAAQMRTELADVDRAVLATVDPGPVLESFVEALRPGPEGVLLDYRLWGGDWGVDWSAVRVPVHLFQGDEDRMVPPETAPDLAARLPEGVARLHPLEGVGHLSIVARIPEILDVL